MLQLTHDQVALLGAGARERFVKGLAPALAPLWPAVAQRLGDRLDSFVELAVEHAQRYGLSSGAAVATYVNLWFLWGPRFDEQSGFEWAREILLDPRRDERGRTYPLVAASLQRLQRPQPPGAAGKAAPPADVLGRYVASQRAVEARFALSSGLDAAAGRPAPRPVTGVCDVDRIEVALASKDGAGLYTRSLQGWTYGPAVAAPPLVVEAGALQKGDLQDDMREGLRLAAVAPSRGAGAPARLRVHLEARQRCRVQQHPHVRLVTADGARQWRGALDIEADLSAPAAPAEPPPIASAGAAARVQLDVEGCGVRVDGVPLGRAGIGIDVHPSAQWLREVRHGAMAPLHLPEAAAPAAGGGIECRLERNGVASDARDARALRQGFERLRSDFAAAMKKLLGAWTATAGVERAGLQVTPGLLEGAASFAWGWRMNGPEACLAVGAEMKMAACAIDLALEGDLAVEGARARITLRSKGRAELNFSLDRLSPQENLEEAMSRAQARFRFPFVLQVDAQASPSLAVIGQAAAVTGALSGSCGLRPGGGGYEWYFELKSEPVSTVIAVSDPVTGRRELPRPLLPALPLVSWSLR